MTGPAPGIWVYVGDPPRSPTDTTCSSRRTAQVPSVHWSFWFGGVGAGCESLQAQRPPQGCPACLSLPVLNFSLPSGKCSARGEKATGECLAFSSAGVCNSFPNQKETKAGISLALLQPPWISSAASQHKYSGGGDQLELPGRSLSSLECAGNEERHPPPAASLCIPLLRCPALANASGPHVPAWPSTPPSFWRFPAPRCQEDARVGLLWPQECARHSQGPHAGGCLRLHCRSIGFQKPHGACWGMVGPTFWFAQREEGEPQGCPPPQPLTPMRYTEHAKMG